LVVITVSILFSSCLRLTDHGKTWSWPECQVNIDLNRRSPNYSEEKRTFLAACVNMSKKMNDKSLEKS
jgi:hypothetical protein